MIAQLALSVVLLAGAGLLWRSFYVLYRTEPGLETAGMVTTRLTLPDAKSTTRLKNGAGSSTSWRSASPASSQAPSSP